MADLTLLKFSRRSSSWVSASEQNPSIASGSSDARRDVHVRLASVTPLRPRGGVTLVLVSSTDATTPG